MTAIFYNKVFPFLKVLFLLALLLICIFLSNIDILFKTVGARFSSYAAEDMVSTFDIKGA